MTARGERMYAELVDTATLSHSIMPAGALQFLGAWHLAMRFMREHPSLAAELLDEIDRVFEQEDGPAAHALSSRINDFLVEAARE